jgi:wobble nucleotide-excising tRNase
MIKKIKSIKNMAVYIDFDWDKSVREKGGKPAEFQRVNILYGRNYSGKTTASRIVRALETGSLTDKYQNPEFNIEIQGEINVTQSTLKSHQQTIRVFNEDFVRDNLRFIANPDESIKSFAILGDDNNKLEIDIQDKQRELGSEEAEDGFLGELKRRRLELSNAEKAVQQSQLMLDNKLSDKANKANTGIKHNKQYGDANYNVVKLKADIAKVTITDYTATVEETVDKLKQLLKEEPKLELHKPQLLDLQFTQFVQLTQQLVEKKIAISEPIQTLLEDILLQEWVRSGREHHEGKRTSCGFCGNVLPINLMDKLDKHFNQESEDLRLAIISLIAHIEQESKRVHSLILFNSMDFYSTYRAEVENLKIEFDSSSIKYIDSLSQLIEMLKVRLSNIFKPFSFEIIEDVSKQLENIRFRFETLGTESNNYTKTLSKKQQEAKIALRLHEVFNFIRDIKHSDELLKIEELRTIESTVKTKQVIAQSKVTELKRKIEELKAQLKDESKGADRVNHYLNNFFGHESLSLVAKEGETGYRFEVSRNGQKAHHLSEGECSLVAFCYFMAKLEDVETKDNSPIIWIDDPISSLDGNHIFFVFGLINSEIIKNGKFKQLFISTHNLDFLKYLKRLLPKDAQGIDLQRRYFVIERASKGSQISIMPTYLQSYVTEFNYLFHQIYKCANADVNHHENDHDCFYNYGNNARKFLESYLYYRYPSINENDEIKLMRFFGDDTLSTVLTERINNEYSHLAGVFERSINPIDIPEMKKTAQFILNQIKAKDPDQYNALLESIGITN